MLQQHPGLYYAPSEKHRYGMFCAEDIVEGSIIEICPVLIIPKDEAALIDQKSILYHYYFEWLDGQIAIALGYGSLYNHHASPNAEFDPDYESEKFIFKAISPISAGTEIYVNYHAGLPGKKLWFEVK